MYSQTGRPSIPPDRLLQGELLIALFSVRGHRLFCEMVDSHILFRWFLDMSLDEPVFDHSTFSQNSARLLTHEAAQKFFDAVVKSARGEGLLSDEHVTVDGTLIEAWASLKSVKPTEAPAPTAPRMIPATRPWTSTETDAPMSPIRAPPTRRPCWPARARARKPSCASRGMS